MKGPHPAIPLLPAAIGVVLGIELARWMEPSVGILWLLGTGLALVRAEKVGASWICLMALALSYWTTTARTNPEGEKKQLIRESTIVVECLREFDTRTEGKLAGIFSIREGAAEKISIYLDIGEFPETDLGKHCRLRVRGRLVPLNEKWSEGGFEAYLLRQNVRLRMDQAQILEVQRTIPKREQLRQTLLKKLRGGFSRGELPERKTGDLWAALFLGQKQWLSEERLERLKHSGTLHFFAVSGLHVATVAVSAWKISGWLFNRGRRRILPALIIIWSYIWLTGASISAQRAGIMASILLISMLLRKQRSSLNALLLAMMATLLWNPFQMHGAGFQLSFAIASAIVLIALPWAAHWKQLKPDQPSWIPVRWPGLRRRMLHAGIDIFTVGTTAGLIAAPLVVQHFGLFSPVGWILGWILMQIVALLMAMGMAVAFLELAAPFLLPVLNAPFHYLLALVDQGIERAILIPGAFSTTAWPFYGAGMALTLITLVTGGFLRCQQLRFPSRGWIHPAWSLAIPLVSLAIFRQPGP